MEYETAMDVAAEIRDAVRPNFLKLSIGEKEGFPVVVNVAHIVVLEPLMDRGGTDVTLASGHYLQVREEFEDIRRALNKAGNMFYPYPLKPVAVTDED